MESGSRLLEKGLNEGAAKLRAALWLEERTGIPLNGSSDTTRAALASSLRLAGSALLAGHGTLPKPAGTARSSDLCNVLVQELDSRCRRCRADRGGRVPARHEVTSILENPVGRRALTRLMINDETLRDHPELRPASVPTLHPTDTAPGSI